jgi:hypothetical protein
VYAVNGANETKVSFVKTKKDEEGIDTTMFEG